MQGENEKPMSLDPRNAALLEKIANLEKQIADLRREVNALKIGRQNPPGSNVVQLSK